MLIGTFNGEGSEAKQYLETDWRRRIRKQAFLPTPHWVVHASTEVKTSTQTALRVAQANTEAKASMRMHHVWHLQAPKQKIML